MSYTNEGENYRKYGIVIIESYDKTLGYTVYEYRKPTIKERQEIILNYILQNNNEPIDLIYLSNKLCVSKRTIQKDIKVLQSNNLIEVIPNFTQGSQRRNIIKYIGPQKDITGKELTLELLYDLDNPYGFRDNKLLDVYLTGSNSKMLSTDIATVNKYLDLCVAQGEVPETIKNHYALLYVKASSCIECGLCETRCPFGVKIINKMQQAKKLLEE